MGLLITITLGLVIWIIGFALSWGRSPVDPFLIAVALTVIAITVRAVKPYLDRIRGNE